MIFSKQIFALLTLSKLMMLIALATFGQTSSPLQAPFQATIRSDDAETELMLFSLTQSIKALSPEDFTGSPEARRQSSTILYFYTGRDSLVDGRVVDAAVSVLSPGLRESIQSSASDSSACFIKQISNSAGGTITIGVHNSTSELPSGLEVRQALLQCYAFSLHQNFFYSLEGTEGRTWRQIIIDIINARA